VRVRVIALLLVATALSATGCVAAPEVSGHGSHVSLQPSSSTSACPATIDGAVRPFNTRAGLSLVDPSTTEVLVCRYVSNGLDTWTPDASGVLTGQWATAAVVEMNDLPAANTLMRCPSSTREELLFLTTGTAVTAEFLVQLDGCRFATDGTRTVSWNTDDPLTN
jgi:hypothetical protein